MAYHAYMSSFKSLTAQSLLENVQDYRHSWLVSTKEEAMTETHPSCVNHFLKKAVFSVTRQRDKMTHNHRALMSWFPGHSLQREAGVLGCNCLCQGWVICKFSHLSHNRVLPHFATSISQCKGPLLKRTFDAPILLCFSS